MRSAAKSALQRSISAGLRRFSSAQAQ